MSKLAIKKLETKSKDELLDIISEISTIKGVAEFITLHYLLTPADKVKELSKTFAKYKRKTKFHDYYEAIRFYTELTDEVLKPIESSLIKDAPEASANLVQNIIDSFEKLIEAKDDSSGCATEFLYNCVELWGKAWYGVINRDLNQLAKLVTDYYLNHQYIGLEILTYFKLALGKNGLIAAEAYLASDKKALLYVIELQNDPEKYIATVQKNFPSDDLYKLKIATMLIEDFRNEEALSWLKQIPANLSDMRKYTKRQELLIRALSAEGMAKDAQIERWAAFERTLEAKYYNEFSKYASADEQELTRNKAIALAEKAADFNATLAFLESIQEYQHIQELIINNPEKLDQYNYSYYRKLSKSLAANGKFIAAALIRRSLVNDLVAKAASKYYDYAVSDLKLAIEFGNQVEDWQGSQNNDDYLNELKLTHKKKYSFWERIQFV